MECRECFYQFDSSTIGMELCPRCKSNIRALEEHDSAGIGVADHAMLDAKENGRTVGFRESRDKGRWSAADSHGGGKISSHIFGSPTQGEEDNLTVIRVLVQALNLIRGDRWRYPDKLEPDGAADHVLRWQNDPRKSQPVQVTRAVIDKDFYISQKRTGGSREGDLNTEDIARRLYEAVKKKEADLTPTGCRGLYLALDATRNPACCFTDVVECFHSLYSSSKACKSFKQVWIVGPTDTMTQLLASSDRDESAGS